MKTKSKRTAWSDEEMLFALHARTALGQSASEISRGLLGKFGILRSRSSIIGTLHRITVEDAAAHGIQAA